MITLYSEVRRPLTIEEADGNIEDLDTRLRSIEAQGLLANGIASLDFDQVAGTIAIAFTDGTIVGPFQLPYSMFNPRGPWLAETPYQVRDYVTADTGSYVATASHVAGASFADDLAAGRWQLNSARGPEGKPYVSFQGKYDVTRAYAQGDLIWLDEVGQRLFRALIDVPANSPPGTFAPDQAGTPYWSQLSYNAPEGTDEVTYSMFGKPGASSQLYRRRFSRKGRFDPTFNGAVAVCDVAPAAEVRFRILVNSFWIASAIFAAGSKNATFLMQTNANLSFNAGDSFSIIAPQTQDANLSGLDISIPYQLT